MIPNPLKWFNKRKLSTVSKDQWVGAQATNLRWYTERMFKPKINDWDPLLNFFADRLMQEGKVLLEVGPGPTGGMLKFLCGKRKIGIEPLAQAFSDKGFLNISQGDILFLDCLGENIPLVAESIDIALCIHSLGHAQHPYEILKELDRLLITGGEIWILDFLRTEAQTTVDHPVALSEQNLDQWFSNNGYKVERKDTSTTVQENDLILPVYYGIFEKTKENKPLNKIINFSIYGIDLPVYGGWYQQETGGRPARWVSDTFQAFLGHEPGCETLFLEGYAVVDHFPEKSLRISMEVDGLALGIREIRETGSFTLTWPLPDVHADKIQVIGRCSNYFVPDQVLANGDDRELSVLVFRLGVE